MYHKNIQRAECKCSGSNKLLDYVALNSSNLLDKTNEIGVVLTRHKF